MRVTEKLHSLPPRKGITRCLAQPTVKTVTGNARWLHQHPSTIHRKGFNTWANHLTGWTVPNVWNYQVDFIRKWNITNCWHHPRVDKFSLVMNPIAKQFGTGYGFSSATLGYQRATRWPVRVRSWRHPPCAPAASLADCILPKVMHLGCDIAACSVKSASAVSNATCHMNVKIIYIYIIVRQCECVVCN